MSEEETKKESRRSAKTEVSKRELEQAPLMLRKASTILLIGALLPFFSGLKYAATAVNKANGTTTMAFDWKTLIIAKVLVLIGGWVLYECHKVRSGEKPQSPLAAVANAHSLAGLVVTSLFWIGALAFVFMAPGVNVINAAENSKEVFKLGAVAEVMTLMLAVYTFTHIYDYEHGGKFNPIIPLLMIGPGLAGLMNLIAIGSAFSNPHSGLGALGLIGSIICAAGGGLAIYTMYASIQEAKVQGEIKKAAMREHRKAQRARQRGQ